MREYVDPRNGVPIYCFCIVMLFPFLSFLQVSNSSSIVLTWLVNLITAGGLIDYIVMCTTYIFYHRACQAQNHDRRQNPYYGYFQPYCAWIGLVCEVLVVLFFGYSSFRPWSVEKFFQYYTMVIVAPVLFVFWKLLQRTSFVKPLEADLVWQRPTVDAYEASFTHPPSSFWEDMLRLVGIKRTKRASRV